MIATKDFDIHVAMNITPDIIDFDVTPSSDVNGAINDYKISTLSPIPHFDDDKLIFTFPPEVTVFPNMSCTAGSNVKSVTCELDG